jgi:hypothetical protein
MCERRIVIKFNQPRVDVLAYPHVQTATDLQSEAVRVVLNGEIELRKQIENLLLRVGITIQPGQHMPKRLEARAPTIVFELYPAEQIVNPLFVRERLGYTRRREFVDV